MWNIFNNKQASSNRSASQHLRRRVNGTDRIAIVGFHDEAMVIAKPAEPHAAWLQERSSRLHEKVTGSWTNMTDGLRKAIQILERTPSGIYRKIWLLTDGYPNRETSYLMQAVEQARQARININCIGFGDKYDEELLRRISGATHNGKFVPVQTLRELTDALVLSSGNRNQHHHRAETCVLTIDLSVSMLDSMEGKRKIDIVEQAILQLLHYKQQCFS
jgi:Mg-chelatase subunit ChlD